MEHVQYQLEQKMGDGSWSRVYQTKEEADYETPAYVSFQTKEEAEAFGNSEDGYRGWGPNCIRRGIVRILCVRTTITVVE